MSRPTITMPPEYKMDHHSLVLRRDKNSKPRLTSQDYELSPIPSSSGWCGTCRTPPLPLEQMKKQWSDNPEQSVLIFPAGDETAIDK